MKLISTGEAAQRLGVGLSTVKRWIQLDLIKAVRTPGGHWRIAGAEVAHLLDTMETGHVKPLRMLVIEDDANMCELISKWLQHDDRMNIEAECIHDGLLGLLQLGRMTPDLLVLDIGLPGMSGLEVLQRINAVPEFADMRVIVVTGKRNRALVDRQISMLKPDAVLDKPFDEETFLAVVCETFSRDQSDISLRKGSA